MNFKTPAFIGYIVAGDGGIDYSIEAALALEAGGVDLLELGIPFTDPVADGPAIQKGMERALKGGMTPDKVLELVKRLRHKTKIPIVLMSYFNPIMQGGKDFLRRAKEAGVGGILIVDLPFEEKEFRVEELDQIFLITPSTTEERMRQIAKGSRGFIYYAIQKGTTGARDSLPEGVKENIQKIKQIASIPVCAGFGIANRESAQQVLSCADGFIVGSAFVDAMEKRLPPKN